MKKTSLSLLLVGFAWLPLATDVSAAEETYKPAKPVPPSIYITYPSGTSTNDIQWKRNTEGRWSWVSFGTMSYVDIYLLGVVVKAGESPELAFVKNYPRDGSFSWAVGYSMSEWNVTIPNGRYQIVVCPAGTTSRDFGGLECASFFVQIYGDTPTIEILTPTGGTFRAGDDINVSFTHSSSGEQYKINLLLPALVSPTVYSLGTVMGTVSGISAGVNTHVLTIPPNVPAGTYTLEVVQLGNGGQCLNTCAQAESKPFTINPPLRLENVRIWSPQGTGMVISFEMANAELGQIYEFEQSSDMKEWQFLGLFLAKGYNPGPQEMTGIPGSTGTTFEGPPFRFFRLKKARP